MTVPFVDLKGQYLPIQQAIENDVLEVLRSWWVVGGPFLNKFEEEFAEYMGVDFAIGCSSGTSALEVALRALEIGPGDRVLVPVNTFIASAFAITAAGATPVFVDVDPSTYLMSVDGCIKELSKQDAKSIKAIMPVHLYGQMVDMKLFAELAKDYGVALIEDAAQAIGARSGGYGVGELSDIACTSFYPAKNLGTCGQGGAIITKSPGLAEVARQIINQGSASKYDHVIIGHNHRLDSIHAAQLRHALKSLDSWNARRREVAARYDKAFGNRAPFIDPIAVPVFHLYEYKCDSKEDREALMAWLGEAGVACGLHYPSIITDSTPYLTKDKGGFRVARDLCDRLLSLPVFPTMTNEQVDEVIAAVEAYRSQ